MGELSGEIGLFLTTMTSTATTKGDGMVQSRQLLLETSIAVEDLRDLCVNIISDFNVKELGPKKKIVVQLKSLQAAINRIHDNLVQSFVLTCNSKFYSDERRRIMANRTHELKREMVISTT